MEPSDSVGPSQPSQTGDRANLHAPVPTETVPASTASMDTKITMMSADSSYASSSLDDGDSAVNEKVLQQLDSFSLAKGKLNASLDEANGSVPYPSMDAPFWKKLCAFSGLGLMVSVGYFDPGNWATDIAGGSSYGYSLMCVILFSSVLAMFLQFLALKLGIAAEMDLAQACRVMYHPYVNFGLWIVMEVAICATDLAESLGSAIALNLLTGMPLYAGVLITGADVIFLMFFELRNFRYLEGIIGLLTATIAVSFVYELAVVKPHWPAVFEGLIPDRELFSDPDKLYTAIGILGATVMPHNLFLHSSTIQTRAYPRCKAGKTTALQCGAIDSFLALCLAFFINAAILILAAAAFYFTDNPNNVGSISTAFELLAPAMGAKAAPIIFAIALLCAGQQSTITGTMAGQIVMEGFVDIRLPTWQRRLITRGVAIIPALVIAAIMGAKGVEELLILSQVILSLALTFAVVPLVHFTSSKRIMGTFANHWSVIALGVACAILIAGLNLYSLIVQLLPGGGGLWGTSS